MTPLEEFRRWQDGTGAYQIVSAVRRWQKMAESDKQSLRRKWAKEDATELKLRERDEQHG